MSASDHPRSERLAALVERSCQHHVDSGALIARARDAETESCRLANQIQARRLRQQLSLWRAGRLGTTAIGGLRLAPPLGHDSAN